MGELERGHTAARFVAVNARCHGTDTFPCLNCRQANLMRFSSIFQRKPRPREPRPEETLPADNAQPASTAVPPAKLPEDLDARVRLLGEWQVSEQ
jgi:hypothetical protein